jgi:hypothetical protein
MGHHRRSKSVTEEDEEFNRIEREAAMRKEAVAATITKREWVGLTHEKIEEVWAQVESSDFRDCVHPFARALEKYLKEENGM